jgi:diguanylate cyclase (GGDEF)-like protein/PAS domain S-box-containing protein
MRLQQKLVVPVVVLLLAMIIVGQWVVIPMVEQQAIKNRTADLQRNLRLLSTAIRPIILSNDYGELYGVLDRSLEDYPYWYSLEFIDDAGLKLYPLDAVDNHPQDFQTISHQMMLNEKPLGVLTLKVNIRAQVQEQFKSIKRSLNLILAIFVLFTVSILYMQSRSLVRPVKRLNDAVKAVSKGDMSTQINITSKDEIGELVDSFNKMQSQLAAHDEELRKLVLVQEVARKAQDHFISGGGIRWSVQTLLEQILAITESHSGFVVEYRSEYAEPIVPLVKSNDYIKINDLTPDGRKELDQQKVLDELLDCSAKKQTPSINNQIQHCGTLEQCITHGRFLNIMTMPLIAREKVVGLVMVCNSPNAYSHRSYLELRDLLQAIGNLIEAQEQRNKLIASEERYRNVVDNAVNGIVTIDEDGIVVSFNRAAERILGYPSSQIIGENIKRMVPADVESYHDELVKKAVRSNKKSILSGDREVMARHQNGNEIPIQISITKIHTEQGYEFIAIFTDISERRKRETEIRQAHKELSLLNQKLERLSRVDGLTGIANRRCFDESLEAEIARCRRSKTPISLILCDIDYFKKFNDHYGHPAGDSCLSQVALVLQSCFMRAGEVVARYGGEEFAVVLPTITDEQCRNLCNTLQARIAEMGIPHEQSDVSKYVTLSVGVATVIPDEQCNSESLVTLADTALYQAKETGRNRCAFYQPEK